MEGHRDGWIIDSSSRNRIGGREITCQGQLRLCVDLCAATYFRTNRSSIWLFVQLEKDLIISVGRSERWQIPVWCGRIVSIPVLPIDTRMDSAELLLGGGAGRLWQRRVEESSKINLE